MTRPAPTADRAVRVQTARWLYDKTRSDSCLDIRCITQKWAVVVEQFRQCGRLISVFCKLLLCVSVKVWFVVESKCEWTSAECV